MSEEFINLLKELFPSISTGAKEQLQVFIKQYQGNPKLYYSLKSRNEIYQGDIISKIPFLYIKENGEIKQGILDGMIISQRVFYLRSFGPAIVLFSIFACMGLISCIHIS